MDDEQLLDNTQATGLGLWWRALVGVIAILVVGAILFPLVRTQSGNIQADPNSAEGQFELGNAHYEAGEWEQAITAYQRAVELDPNYQAAYANMGVAYYQQQEFDLAASQYQKALELNPEDGEVSYNLGALYLQQALAPGGQPDLDLVNRAITQLQRAMEISPDLAEPYFTLGVAYFALNQKEKAIETFEMFLSRESIPDSRARQEAERYLEILRAQ
jgi:superkiller protein 3